MESYLLRRHFLLNELNTFMYNAKFVFKSLIDNIVTLIFIHVVCFWWRGYCNINWRYFLVFCEIEKDISMFHAIADLNVFAIEKCSSYLIFRSYSSNRTFN